VQEPVAIQEPEAVHAPAAESPAVADVDTADAIARAAEDASPEVPKKKKKKLVVDPGA
jgi:hypothetical protein